MADAAGSPPLVLAQADDASELGCALAKLLIEELIISGLHAGVLDRERGWYSLQPTFAQLVAEAERVTLTKPALDPTMGFIAVRAGSLHLLASGHRPDQLFTPSERVMLTVSLTNRPVLCESQIAQLPARGSWHAQAVCSAGSSICGACEALGSIAVIAPHDPRRRAALLNAWVRPSGFTSGFTYQPMRTIRAYFGPSEVTFYFELLGYLTRALVLPVVGALLMLGCSLAARALLPAVRAELYERVLTGAFAAALLVWAAAFGEGWKRHEARCALEWGTLNATDGDLGTAARTGFSGSEARYNPRTDRLEPHFPTRRRALRYALTVPATLVCVALAAADMFVWLWASYAARQRWPGSSPAELVLQQSGTVGYVVSVALLSAAYKPIAAALTEFENYRSAETHRNALIAKRVLFELCNNYGALFYVAFYNRDLAELRASLVSLLVLHQVLSQAVETIPPAAVLALRRWRQRRVERAALKAASPTAATPTPPPSTSASAQPSLARDVGEQLCLAPYEPFGDYLELVVQFGNVLLFAAALPIAPLFALANNVQEIRADAHKLLAHSRRPAHADTTRHVRGIGAWRTALQTVTAVAAVTNVALLTFTLGWLEELQPAMRAIVFLAAEQLVLCVIALVSLAQPRWPDDVVTRLSACVLAQERALLDMAKPLGQRLRARHTAVARLQAVVRGRAARAQYAKAMRAVVLIQTAARAFLRRRRDPAALKLARSGSAMLSAALGARPTAGALRRKQLEHALRDLATRRSVAVASSACVALVVAWLVRVA